MRCLICGFDSVSARSLAYHLTHSHSMSSQQYYDEFFNDSKFCPICGKPNKFLGLRSGYSNFCSKQCQCKTDEFKQRMHNAATEYWKSDHLERNNKIRNSAAKMKEEIDNLNGIPVQELIAKYGQVWYKHKVVPVYMYKNRIGYIDKNDLPKILAYIENIKEYKSSYEYDICQFIRLFYDKDILHNIKINNHEVDIFLPDLNLIIEYNGKHWHDMRKNEKEKYRAMKEQGYKIYIIEEHKDYDDFLKELDKLKIYIEAEDCL